jgi:hypothetical protein
VVAFDCGRVEQLTPLAAGAGAEEVPVAAPQFGVDAGASSSARRGGEVFDPLLAVSIDSVTDAYSRNGFLGTWQADGLHPWGCPQRGRSGRRVERDILLENRNLSGGFSGMTTYSTAGLVTVRSAHFVAVTVDRLAAAVAEAGLNVFARIDHAVGPPRLGAS